MIYDLPVDTSVRPAGWAIKPLGDIANVIGGGTPDTGNPQYWNPPEVPWVTPTDITACSGPVLTNTERSISQAGLRDSSATLLPAGATLLTSRATIGECRLAGVAVTTNQGFASLVPKDQTDPRFLFYLAQSVKPVFVRLAAGTTFAEVSRREIRRVNVCVPAEQGEQAEIGRLMELTDKAVVVAEAKLAAARRLKTALMQQLFTRGVLGRHKHFQTTRIFGRDYGFPAVWDAAQLRESIEAIEYGTNAPSNDRGHGLPVIAIPEVVSTRFRLGELPYAEVSEAEANGLRLLPDDLLLIRTNGNPDYIGKSTVIGDEAEQHHVIFASYLIRIRTRKAKLSGRYLNYFLASPLGRRQCLAMANTSAGNHNLSSRSLRQFCLPRPSLDEQAEIVALVDAAEDSIESVENEVAALDRLKRSLLQNLLTGRVRVQLENE